MAGGFAHMMRTDRRRSSWLPSLVSAAVAIALFAAPAPALARRSASDVVAGAPLSADKRRAAAAPDVDAASGILVGPDGSALWSRQAGARKPMASTTKMMTALIAIERGGLDDYVTVSRAASGVEYGIGLRAGERLTKRKLLELALVASSNDAAYALGESTAGNMPTFVKWMNDRARSLGLRDTRYVNPHGLDAPGHYSSAADLASLAPFAMTLPDFRRIVAMRSVSLPAAPGRPLVLQSTDELLGSYAGLAGVKTGFTDGAGYSFVAMAERGGITLTSVVLATPDDASRFAQSARLLDWGFAHMSRRPLTSRMETVGKVGLSADRRTTIPVRLGEATSALVLDLAGPIERRVSLVPQVGLPVFEGQPLGEVIVKQGTRVLARVPAVAATSVASVDETVGSVPVSDYVDRTVLAVTRRGATAPAFDPRRPVSRRVQLDPGIAAPVPAGTRVGEVVYTQAGRVIVKVPVVTAMSVSAPGFLEKVGITLVRGWRSLVGAPTTASLRLGAS